MLCTTIGNTITKSQRNQPANTLGGIEVDYYFMANRFGGSKFEISMSLWTIIVDEEGYVYAMRTRHIGHFETWEDVIRGRIQQHIYSIGFDGLFVKRLVRDLEIKKDGHLIPYDVRSTGDNIGIDGSTEIFIRRSKFKYIK